MIMEYKKTGASKDTETRNVHEISNATGNIYEALAIVSKRAVQIGEDIKQELM